MARRIGEDRPGYTGNASVHCRMIVRLGQMQLHTTAVNVVVAEDISEPDFGPLVNSINFKVARESGISTSASSKMYPLL